MYVPREVSRSPSPSAPSPSISGNRHKPVARNYTELWWKSGDGRVQRGAMSGIGSLSLRAHKMLPGDRGHCHVSEISIEFDRTCERTLRDSTMQLKPRGTGDQLQVEDSEVHLAIALTRSISRIEMILKQFEKTVGSVGKVKMTLGLRRRAPIPLQMRHLG